MGWFSSSNDAPTQQFGAPSTFGAPAMGMGGGMMMNNGMAGQMDPMAMQQMAQNPMMQAMANDPVQATARLLQYNDPIAAFIQTNSMGLLMDLFSVSRFIFHHHVAQQHRQKIWSESTA